MRHLKADVSHRMRRRPSIFAARWFRLVLGGGAIIALALWLGPPVAGWVRGQVTRPASLVSRQAILPTAGATDPTLAVASPRPDPAPAVRTPPAGEPRPAPPAPKAKAAPEVPAAHVAEPPRRVADAAPEKPSAPARAETPGPTAVPGSPSGLFRIQVGAFRESQNADRLAERLRSEGADVSVAGSSGDSGSLYRIIARPPDGEAVTGFVERVRRLGHRVEERPEGVIIGEPVPVRAAIETTRQLREQGVRVRLERVPAPGGLRIVRVGNYSTLDEAERARGELVARGYPAVVVRER